MKNPEILHRITEMAEEERRLRGSLGTRRSGGSAERSRLDELERELDQCWDLLRQRRAKSEFGQDPDEAHTRPQSLVEGYES
ncbi:MULTISPECIES: DUF2630 family protein [Streptomyces]|uniref:DUF2630 family protein n=2 Tax=Streptomyces TaxID=1883 RepID=A0ABT9L999_STRGD|nr:MULTISPECIES: DUF2630 family protein [Streptomyces]MDP9680277.1 hypothetical protein [Streptomyces griseoviridis]GGT09778.1 hypothetical protein GCM10010240_49030 [Streptomyces griseoviridis]GGU53181.1 hypothetical protein GCM10010259_50700 [Streptomyces daghestanicus]GHI29209.1 hypothetical protein Sdagh_09390 [Streptomyces daghestanicus]